MMDLCSPCSDMDSHSVGEDACTVVGTAAAEYSRGSSRIVVVVAWWRLELTTATKRVDGDERLSVSLVVLDDW